MTIPLTKKDSVSIKKGKTDLELIVFIYHKLFLLTHFLFFPLFISFVISHILSLCLHLPLYVDEIFIIWFHNRETFQLSLGLFLTKNIFTNPSPC